ncbi:hypothetical protein [Ferrovibrio sp.]|uniref:hypothetical protein n=1 Tax=Ferrovibrio sp. TaxID=1917215 RepID=UPI002612E018|nr:hypothetical protein [Ferrovibrio sp.]
MRSLTVPVIVAAALLAACAPGTEWSRPDTTAAQRQIDETDCEAIGAWQALDESFASRPIYPPYNETQFIDDAGPDGGGRSVSYSRRGARQYELTDYCMKQRGYVLVPIAKP